MKYCPYCGAAQEVSAASFCPDCGALLAGQQPKRPSTPAPIPRSGAKCKKKKRRSQTQAKATPAKRQPADEGYDGYYRDTPVADGGQVRVGLDPILAKRIVLLTMGVLLVIGLAVLARIKEKQSCCAGSDGLSAEAS